jgi:hypothetical protein
MGTKCVVTLANGQNYPISTGGLDILFIAQSMTGQVAVYIVTNGVAYLVFPAPPGGLGGGGPSGYSWVDGTTAPASGSCSVAYDGSASYRVYNNQGGTNTFCWNSFQVYPNM